MESMSSSDGWNPWDSIHLMWVAAGDLTRAKRDLLCKPVVSFLQVVKRPACLQHEFEQESFLCSQTQVSFGFQFAVPGDRVRVFETREFRPF